jgi:outer membrane protein
MRETHLNAALWGLAALSLLAAEEAQAATPPAPAAAAAPAAPATTPPQAAAPVAVAPPANPVGPLIAGVCLLSQEGVITRSKVGQATTARLRELAQQVQSNLTAEQARLQARGKVFEAKRATLTPLQQEAEGKALQQRGQALQAQAGERQQQLDATKTRALSQVLNEAQPFITQAYAAHGCGLLFAREAVLSGNLANDLTPEVVAALDAKAAFVPFELEPPRPAK